MTQKERKVVVLLHTAIEKEGLLEQPNYIQRV